MEQEVVKVFYKSRCDNQEEYTRQKRRNTGKTISKAPLEKWQHLYIIIIIIIIIILYFLHS